MQVVRVLNNNTVLAGRPDGSKVVLMGKGLGFGRRLGDPVDRSAIQHTFVPGGSHPIGRLADLVGDLPIEITQTAGTIMRIGHERTGVPVTQALLLAIADHLAFAVRRGDHGAAAYPLAWEVSQLFPDELAVGRAALELIATDHGVRLPPEEATAFALHFVNAQLAGGDLSRTVAMTRRITQLPDVVAAAMDVPLDHQSMSVARFVTHLRYLFVRLEQERQIADTPSLLEESVRAAHPRSYRAAERVREVLEMDGRHLLDDEVTYLALHVARLASDSDRPT